MSKLYFYETELCCFKLEPKKALFSLILFYSAMIVFPNYTQLSWNHPIPECLPWVTTKQGLLNQPWMRVWPWTPGINYSNIILLKSRWSFLSGLWANAHVLHRCGNRELNESSGDFKVSVTISQTVLTVDEQFERKAGLSFKFFWTRFKLASPNVWCSH